MSSYRDAQPPGFEITSDLKTWETSHRCPRCFCEIYAGEKEGFRLEACGRCGGVWVSPEEAKRALVSGSHALEELAVKVLAVTSRVVLQEVEALACPECGQAMEKSHIAGATIDVCPMHGTWFDPHELYAAMDGLRKTEAVRAISGGRGVEYPASSPANGVEMLFERVNTLVRGAVDSVASRRKDP
jgi:Zn-finger nucleic acid-binding protein